MFKGHLSSRETNSRGVEDLTRMRGKVGVILLLLLLLWMLTVCGLHVAGEESCD